MWARVTALEDVKCSGNWMWAAKLPGEGARMWDCCEALKDAMLELGVGIDGKGRATKEHNNNKKRYTNPQEHGTTVHHEQQKNPKLRRVESMANQ